MVSVVVMHSYFSKIINYPLIAYTVFSAFEKMFCPFDCRPVEKQGPAINLPELVAHNFCDYKTIILPTIICGRKVLEVEQKQN